MKASDGTDNATLTELGRRLVSGSLSDAAIQRATEATPNFAILPWVNVVKIGGQSIMDRGRSAVAPVVDEIVANLHRHKMILGTGAGTRARHVYSLAIDLGLPIGVLTVLGTAVAWQNAQMLQYLLAKHGIAFLEPEGFAWRCHIVENIDATRLCYTELQAAATASHHALIAAARSVRCVRAEVRWRWTLKVLNTAA